jgi:CheY-like chemotaxis protein/anti-sigma regulatory factor (Ser/Thr protein kinase)
MTTVLVVDDLAAHRELAAGLLCRKPGYEAIFAANGAEALAKLADTQADIVLTDMLMPEMNGVELLRAVRRDYPHVPVVLMTASGSEDMAVEALQEGAASYVPKSGLARRLVETVTRVLAAAREERTYSEIGKRLTLQELTFVVENDIELVLTLPAYLKPYLLAAGLTDQLVSLRVHMALEEALVNALYHGNLELGSVVRQHDTDELYEFAVRRAAESPYRERRIHFHVRLTPEQAEFTIRDSGPGFDPAALPDTADIAALDEPHGRGVMLMRTFMDSVRYSETGNEVTMTKRLRPSAPAANAATTMRQ